MATCSSDAGTATDVAGAAPALDDRPRALLVEHAPSRVAASAPHLERAGLSVVTVGTGGAALEALACQRFDLVVLEAKLPDLEGVEVLRSLRERGSTVAVIVVTANGSLETAVSAMRAGACDYLVKPFGTGRLRAAVRRALAGGRPGRGAATGPLAERTGGFIGSSACMQAVYRTVRTAAASRAAIFVTGESGTGKEVCAEAIHRASDRAGRPFVAINCAAIPKDLAESELFGHVKGAFTGAVSHRVGAAAQAHRGTLFLDEVCEMDPQLQTKLLRFLQTGAVRRVGASEAERVDVRVICATNRDPLAEIAAGRFREDLYYRLHVIPIHLPPLRERGGDVLEIARSLLADYAREEGKRFAGLAPCAAAAIAGYGWPGNVRELQNVLRSAVVLNDGEALTAAMLPEAVRGAGPPPAVRVGPSPASAALPGEAAGEALPPGPAEAIRPLWMVERQAIEDAIRRCDDNVARAAEALGISSSTIYRKRQAWATGSHAP